MSTDTDKYAAQQEPESRHSAFEEFSRDERRPAVLLLSALILSAVFFAIGIMIGRWTVEPIATPGAASAGQTPLQSNTNAPLQQQQQTPMGAASSANAPASTLPLDPARRFALLIATYNSQQAAEPLLRDLRQAGYPDARTTAPRPNESQKRYYLLIGHYTREEAQAEAARLRSTGDSRLKNPRVIEDRE